MRCTKSKRKGGREAGSGWRMLIQEGQKEEGRKKIKQRGKDNREESGKDRLAFT